MSKHILLINGPNLNLLGTREPHIYGSTTLHDVESTLASYAGSLSNQHQLSTYQSNDEGHLIDRIHNARGEQVDAIIINPGALAHTSIALRDALTGVNIPFVEVHISNIHQRESFRHHSYLSEKAGAVICGMGTFGYTAALDFLVEHHLKA